MVTNHQNIFIQANNILEQFNLSKAPFSRILQLRGAEKVQYDFIDYTRLCNTALRLGCSFFFAGMMAANESLRQLGGACGPSINAIRYTHTQLPL